MKRQTHDLEWPLQKVKKVIQSGVNTQAGMKELIQLCEQECPGPVWAEIRAINFDENVELMKNWVTRVLAKERPASNIKAYWFGIYNPSLNGHVSCDLYLSGSTTFNPTEKSGDWACVNGTSYFPSLRYANASVLDVIYSLTQHRTSSIFPENCRWKGGCSGSNGCWFGEYVLCLGFAGLVVNEICETIWKPIMATSNEPQAVAVGFDSGDFIILGYIDKNGWYPNKTTK